MKRKFKIKLETLVIEITRRCNMACAHCMRGNSQKIDLDIRKLRIFLRGVISINRLVFSGGEPSLNPKAIKQVLEICKEYGIRVNFIQLSTNGKEVSEEFLNAMTEWHEYCRTFDSKKTCYIYLSKDGFHESVPEKNIERLQGLPMFFRIMEENYGGNANGTGLTGPQLLRRGRAKNISFADYDKPQYYFAQGTVADSGVINVDNEIYFTVNGDVILDCDYEYGTEEQSRMCRWDDAQEFFEKASQSGEKKSQNDVASFCIRAYR